MLSLCNVNALFPTSTEVLGKGKGARSEPTKCPYPVYMNIQTQLYQMTVLSPPRNVDKISCLGVCVTNAASSAI